MQAGRYEEEARAALLSSQRRLAHERQLRQMLSKQIRMLNSQIEEETR